MSLLIIMLQHVIISEKNQYGVNILNNFGLRYFSRHICRTRRSCVYEKNLFALENYTLPQGAPLREADGANRTENTRP